MARKKNPPDVKAEKHQVSARLRIVRVELFGERGGAAFAERIGLPARTWYNYEIGVTVPAEILLRFLDITGVEPQWLLSGQGPIFRETPRPQPPPTADPPSIKLGVSDLLGRLIKGSVRLTWEFEDDPGGNSTRRN